MSVCMIIIGMYQTAEWKAAMDAAPPGSFTKVAGVITQPISVTRLGKFIILGTVTAAAIFEFFVYLFKKNNTRQKP